MKFLQTATFNGQEYAYFLDEATARVFRAPVYDLNATALAPAPHYAPAFPTPPAFSVPPVMPPSTGGPYPAPMTYAPNDPEGISHVGRDKNPTPRSIMPAGLGKFLNEGNETVAKPGGAI